MVAAWFCLVSVLPRCFMTCRLAQPPGDPHPRMQGRLGLFVVAEPKGWNLLWELIVGAQQEHLCALLEAQCPRS